MKLQAQNHLTWPPEASLLSLSDVRFEDFRALFSDIAHLQQDMSVQAPKSNLLSSSYLSSIWTGCK